MATTIVLPGIGGSDQAHWQTIWEERNPAMIRFQPQSWHKPELPDWMTALDRTMAETKEPPFLLAHSIGCLLVVHWAAQKSRPIKGALLVAVPDPDGPQFPAEAISFRGVPTQPLPFPALVIASTNDPFGSLDYERQCAKAWEAGLVVAGELGHINSASGLNDWPQGMALFEAFRAGAKCPGG